MAYLRKFADLVGTQAGDVSMSDDRMEGCLGAHRGNASLILPEGTPLHLSSLNGLNRSDKVGSRSSLAETTSLIQ